MVHHQPHHHPHHQYHHYPHHSVHAVHGPAPVEEVPIVDAPVDGGIAPVAEAPLHPAGPVPFTVFRPHDLVPDTPLAQGAVVDGPFRPIPPPVEEAAVKSLPVLPPTAPAAPHLVPAPVAPHLAPVPATAPAGPDGYVPHPLDHVEGQAYGHDLVGPFYHHSGPFGPFGFYANFFHE